MIYPSAAYEHAVGLLRCCYRSIDADYRQKYRMDLWRQVEAKTKMAATTSPTLTAWVQRFLTFPHTEVREPASLAATIGAADARAVLRLFREEPTVVVALLRAQLESEREATP